MPRTKALPEVPTSCSQQELAALLGTTPKTIIEWGKHDDGLPRMDDGRYHLQDAMRWVRAHERGVGERSRKSSRYDEARTRKMTAEAQLAELDLAERRRELMTVDQTTEVLEESHQRVRAVLLSVPSRHARDFVGLETVKAARAMLQTVVAMVIAELHGDHGDDG